MRIAYLSCALTLPDSPDRRADAFEHDQMVETLAPPFEGKGAQVVPLAWDDAKADWSEFDAALIGSTWDYQDRLEAFLGTLDRIESAIPLFNPTELVRWNCRKTYLRDLAERGVATVPTLWFDEPDEAAATRAFDRFGDEIVFKRQIGANAEGQFRLRRGEPLPTFNHPMMAQPYIASIAGDGELSFVFVDGAFSHALRKTPAPGDYRIQSSYGGSESAYEPSRREQETAQAALEALDEMPLYARVDMVRGGDGSLLLMELELIEPFLYPLQSDGLGERLYEGLCRRLGD